MPISSDPANWIFFFSLASNSLKNNTRIKGETRGIVRNPTFYFMRPEVMDLKEVYVGACYQL